MKYMENEKFSNELKKLLGFIENSLSRELPSPLISIEYFVLAFLQKKDCYAYNVLTNYLTSLAMNTIHDTYFELLNKKALSAVNPNRELKFDEKAQIILDGALKEAELLEDTKVTSVHLLLALLNDYIPNSSVTKVFNRAGVNYKIVTSKLDVLKSNGDNNEEGSNKIKYW